MPEAGIGEAGPLWLKSRWKECVDAGRLRLKRRETGLHAGRLWLKRLPWRVCKWAASRLGSHELLLHLRLELPEACLLWLLYLRDLNHWYHSCGLWHNTVRHLVEASVLGHKPCGLCHHWHLTETGLHPLLVKFLHTLTGRRNVSLNLSCALIASQLRLQRRRGKGALLREILRCRRCPGRRRCNQRVLSLHLLRSQRSLPRWCIHQLRRRLYKSNGLRNKCVRLLLGCWRLVG